VRISNLVLPLVLLSTFTIQSSAGEYERRMQARKKRIEAEADASGLRWTKRAVLKGARAAIGTKYGKLTLIRVRPMQSAYDVEAFEVRSGDVICGITTDCSTQTTMCLDSAGRQVGYHVDGDPYHGCHGAN
jgi:hypothetical protein